MVPGVCLVEQEFAPTMVLFFHGLMIFVRVYFGRLIQSCHRLRRIGMIKTDWALGTDNSRSELLLVEDVLIFGSQFASHGFLLFILIITTDTIHHERNNRASNRYVADHGSFVRALAIYEYSKLQLLLQTNNKFCGTFAKSNWMCLATSSGRSKRLPLFQLIGAIMMPLCWNTWILNKQAMIGKYWSSAFAKIDRMIYKWTPTTV